MTVNQTCVCDFKEFLACTESTQCIVVLKKKKKKKKNFFLSSVFDLAAFAVLCTHGTKRPQKP